ncbi:MAG: LysR family transcriptional regulator substrate-binding protein [Lachnospiraceae bacterium]|nr:LysR family transcriptional regulator substrate-binding protein [Lachnospiraceae bacterium]
MKQDLNSRIHDCDNPADSVTVIMESAFPLIHPLIRDFRLQYPHIKIKCLQMPIPDSQQDFRANLMIQIASQPAQAENSATLFKTRLSLAFSADHPLSHRLFLDLDEVRGEEFILPSHNQDLRRAIDAYFKLVDYTPNIPIEVDNPRLLRKLVASNTGISLLLPAIIKPENEEELCLVPLRQPEGTLYMNLHWNQGEWLSPAARSLRDYILAYFRVSPNTP